MVSFLQFGVYLLFHISIDTVDANIFESALFEKAKPLGKVQYTVPHTKPEEITDYIPSGLPEGYNPEEHDLSPEDYVQKMSLYHVAKDRSWYELPLKASAFESDTGILTATKVHSKTGHTPMEGHTKLVSPLRRRLIGANTQVSMASSIANYPYQSTGALSFYMHDRHGTLQTYIGVASVINSAHGSVALLTAGHNCYRGSGRVGAGYDYYHRLNHNSNAGLPHAACSTHEAISPLMYYMDYQRVEGQYSRNAFKTDFCILVLEGTTDVDTPLRPMYNSRLPRGDMIMATYYNPSRDSRRVNGANWKMRKFRVNPIFRGGELMYVGPSISEKGMSGSALVLRANRNRQIGILVGKFGDNTYWTRITKAKYRIILEQATLTGTGLHSGATQGLANAVINNYNVYKYNVYDDDFEQEQEQGSEMYQNPHDKYMNLYDPYTEQELLWVDALLNFYIARDKLELRKEKMMQSRGHKRKQTKTDRF